MRKLLSSVLLSVILCFFAMPAFAIDKTEEISITIYDIAEFTVSRDDSTFGTLDKNHDGEPDSIGLVEFWYDKDSAFWGLSKNDETVTQVNNIKIEYIDLNRDGVDENFKPLKEPYVKHTPIRAGVTNFLKYDLDSDQLRGSVLMLVDPKDAVFSKTPHVSEGSVHHISYWTWYVPLKITADIELVKN